MASKEFTVSGDRVWVSISRKLNLGNYESIELSLGESVEVLPQEYSSLSNEELRSKEISKVQKSLIKKMKVLMRISQKELGHGF